MAKRDMKYPVPDYIKAVYEKAVELLEAGEPAQTRAILEGLIDQEPAQPRLLNSLGNTYFAENKFTQAERCFKEALKYGPDF